MKKIRNLQKLELRKIKGYGNKNGNNIEGYYYNDIKKVLTKKQFKNFSKFMYGQTVIEIGNEILVYRWDFEKWVWLYSKIN